MQRDKDGGIYMSTKGALAFEVITEFLAGKVNRSQAAQLLQVRERTVSRMARRVEAKGIIGAVHGNRGKTPWNQKSDALKNGIVELIKKKYFDCNIVHCQDLLQEHHGISVAHETLRRWCHEVKLVKRAKRRKGIARHRRERMPNRGLLLQMDGSPHEWVSGREWTLIGAIDDATSEMVYAEFFKSEATVNCMKVLRCIIEKKGIPFAIYVDKAGCFGGGKRHKFNQFKRACRELDIKLLFASSAEAKGRIERAWDTCQDRLVPELRIHDIWTMDMANQYLRRNFLVDYWDRKLTVLPKSCESKYRPLPTGLIVSEILCLKHWRLVNADHTVQWNAKTYKLAWHHRGSIRGHKIEFRTYPDGSWKAFHLDEIIGVTEVTQPQKRPYFSQRNDAPRVTNSLGI